jgi:GDP-4-dehydro-6-deoxy-D-mannose reductase
VAIAEIAARLLELAGAELQLVPDRDLMRPVDVPVVRGDPAKLHAATGWQPEFDLDTTLRDVLEQWRERVT